MLELECKLCKKKFKRRIVQFFCSVSCSNKSRKKDKTGHVDSKGYVKMYGGAHPYSYGRGVIYEHIMVMELAIGRRLAHNEVVHHVNGDRSDNRLVNLVLMDKKTHNQYHCSRANRGVDGKFLSKKEV